MVTNLSNFLLKKGSENRFSGTKDLIKLKENQVNSVHSLLNKWFVTFSLRENK